VPACVEADCPEGQGSAESELRSCCVEGSETTRVFLFDEVGGEFRPAAAAATPLSITGLATRGFLEEGGFRLGRLEVVDLDGDGISEALALVGARRGGILDTRAVLLRMGAGGMEAIEVPRQATVDGVSKDTQVYGFAVTRDGLGHPLLAIAAREGLYGVPVLIGEAGTITLGETVAITDATGEELAETEVNGVEAGDVNGDGIDDLVLTRPFATEVYLGGESLEPPAGTP